MIDDRTIWFNVAITKGLGPVAGQKIARYLAERGLEPQALLEQTAEQLQGAGLSAGIASSLCAQLRDPSALAEPPRHTELVTPGHKHFPNKKLLNANPPLPLIMWAAAEPALLASTAPALALAGSRDAAEEVLALVQRLATNSSRAGWIIVSGLASGVDSAAHQGALDGGGGTIGVLANGISVPAPRWHPNTDEGICLVSQFAPTEPWSAPRAMQRNSTIAALADRVVIASAGVAGGSWEMGQLCLKRKKPLFVLDVPTDVAAGNEKLIRAGATPLDPDDFSSALAPPDAPTTLFG